MRARHIFAVGLGGLPLLTGSWWACSAEDQPASTPDSGADTGGAAAAGGSGGTGQSGGGAGSGGQSPDAASWGAAPKWEAFPGEAVGCTFERLVNAAEVRVFKWLPCSWTDDCEDAEFNPKVLSSDIVFNPTSTVVDDGTTVRVGLAFEFGKNIVLFAGEDGVALDGIRAPLGPGDCHLYTASIWGKRFGVMVHPFGGGSKFGGVLGDIGALSIAPKAFTLPTLPPGISSTGPQKYVLGDSRWLWWWAPVDRLTTVSASDGSDFTIFADTASGPIVGYSEPTTAGPFFVAAEYEVQDGGQVQGKIAYSDGITATKPFLVPEKSADDYGAPAFAHSHLAFMRGVNQKGVNLYDSVEIWATPYSPDPTKLTPSLVGQHQFNSMTDHVGGWGHLGTLAPGPNDQFGVAVWSIEKKQVRTYPMSNDRWLRALLGVSRTHLWVGASEPATGGNAYLMRYKVE